MEPEPPDFAALNEVTGVLTFDSGPKTGSYGAYWSVAVTVDGHETSLRASMSEKVWTRAGLPLPDLSTTTRGTARRNAGGRWNVVSIDAGPRELTCLPATVTGRVPASASAAVLSQGPSRSGDGEAAKNITLQIMLYPDGGTPLPARVPSRTLEWFGIDALPVGFSFLSDWVRKSWGWKLIRIDDASLRALYPQEPDGMPVATGHLDADWHSDDGTKNTFIRFLTAIDGVTLRCRLDVETLRAAGNRSVAANSPVSARLHLREGRWRIAELLEPRPDRFAGSGRDILFAIEVRLFLREPNRSGEVVNWLDILSKDVGIGIARLPQAELAKIAEDDLAPGARLICDLERDKEGWYASRVHRISDQAPAVPRHPPGDRQQPATG